MQPTPAQTLEILAALLTVAAIYGNTRRMVLSWPLGLVSVLLSARVYYQAGLFAETGLQAIYFLSGIYGWWKWRNDAGPENQVEPGRASPGHLRIGLVAAVAGAFVLGPGIARIPGASMPFADAGLTALSLLAQYLLARHWIENWLLWMVVNLGSVVLYLYKDLYYFALLYALLFALAIHGYRSWKRLLPP